MRRDIERATEERDVAKLLEHLRTRRTVDVPPEDRDLHRHDLVALAICRSLATLRDNQGLVAALSVPLGLRAHGTVTSALGTPGGRDELLHAIADPRVALETRIRQADAIRDVFYRAYDSAYMTRVATLARSLAADGELCATVCAQLRVRDVKETDLTPDLRVAIAVLTELHGATESQHARFEAARALASIDPAAYEALGSPAGAALGWLSHPQLDWPYVRFRYAYDSRCAFDKSVVVFEHEGKETEEPERILTDDSRAGSFTQVAIGRTPGRYRAWIRLYKDGAIVSNSYACEFDLPAR
jgi:hypothetical protein